MALDDKKYSLKKDMCVISDKSGVLGLGGVIGEQDLAQNLIQKIFFWSLLIFYHHQSEKLQKF